MFHVNRLPSRFTILILKFEQVHLVSVHEQVLNTTRSVANSVDSIQMLHSAAADLSLHFLLRPVCPNTWSN